MCPTYSHTNTQTATTPHCKQQQAASMLFMRCGLITVPITKIVIKYPIFRDRYKLIQSR